MLRLPLPLQSAGNLGILEESSKVGVNITNLVRPLVARPRDCAGAYRSSVPPLSRYLPCRALSDFPGRPRRRPARPRRRRPGADPPGPHAGHLARRQTRRLQLPRRHLGRRDHRRHRPRRSPRTPPTTSTPSSAPTAGGSPSAPTATAATTSSSSPSQGGQPAPADLRLRQRHGHRLVARRQARPLRLHAQRRLPAELRAVHRAGRGRHGPPHHAPTRARRASSRRTATRIAYVRGPGAWYRKGYRGSSNDDIWICDADGTQQPPADHLRRPGQLAHVERRRQVDLLRQRVLRHAGQHRPPAARRRLNADARPWRPRQPQQITFHKDDGVRRARISAQRRLDRLRVRRRPVGGLARKDGSQPRKLAIEVHADDKVNPERPETFTSHATEFAVSRRREARRLRRPRQAVPDADRRDRAKAVQLTDGPSMDHGAAWAPDGSKILFVSDRDGHEDIYAARGRRPGASEVRRGAQVQDHAADRHAGGRVRRQLRAGRQARRVPARRQAVDDEPRRQRPEGRSSIEPQVFDYDWSPDSQMVRLRPPRRLLRQRAVHRPGDGPTAENPARNVTRYATYNGDVTWSLDGKKLAFLSERRGNEQPASAGPAEAGRARRHADPPARRDAGRGHRLGRHPPARASRSRRCRSTRRPSRRTAARSPSATPAATCGWPARTAAR